MKRIGLFLIVSILLGCSDGAKEHNQQLAEIESSISNGEIGDFEIALQKLNDLKTICTTKIANTEFDTDEESVRETENLKKVIAKIDEHINSLNNEKVAYDEINSGSYSGYNYIKETSNFLAQYPSGLKKKTVQNDQEQALSEFIDSMSGKFQSQFTALDQTNTTSNLFQLVSYTNSETGQEAVEYQPEQFDSALENFVSMKQEISQILQVANTNLTTLKGNTPQSLKQQMDNYENAIKENRRKEEEYVRQLISVAVENYGWEDQANHEIKTHIARERGGFWSSCDASYLTNTITKAEENKVRFLSNKVEVELHYNISSYCGNNAKYKYYDAQFTLVFPFINRKLGDGFFVNRSIQCTSNCD